MHQAEVHLAKSSIGNYRPIGLGLALDHGHRYVSEACIASLLAITGALPSGPISVQCYGDVDETYFVEVGPSEALRIYMESAATTYHVLSEVDSKPTATQAAAEFKRIEAAANRLLQTLHVGSPADFWQSAVASSRWVVASRQSRVCTANSEYPLSSFRACCAMLSTRSTGLHRWAAAARVAGAQQQAATRFVDWRGLTSKCRSAKADADGQ